MSARETIAQSQSHCHTTRETQGLTSRTIAVFGPAATRWFGFLQQRINLASGTTTALARVALDQTVFTPINLTVFLSSMAIMEGGGSQGVKEKLNSTWWPALQKNWLIWPGVQAVNFTIVPLEMRVLVVNVVALGWNCYLSYLNSGGGKTESVTEAVNEKIS